MPKIMIEVEVEELVTFFRKCDTDESSYWGACDVCPVRKECQYYYTRENTGSQLDGMEL